MNLSKAPEHGIAVLASLFDAEKLREVKLLQGIHGNVVDHLILSEWLSRVDGEIGCDISSRVEVLIGLKQAELSNDILGGCVVSMVDSLVSSGCEFRENLSGQLDTPVESATESDTLKGHSHPGLTEDGVVALKMSL